jgi:Lrp/AsnC family leucine-responsive transcriptional regulator
MDEIDGAILDELQRDSRMSMAELGKKLGIAPSTAFKRIEKLKKHGIIEKFTIAINPSYFENNLVTFFTIKADPEEKEAVAAFLSDLYLITEVYETLEPCDFIAKARVQTITQLKMEILIPLSEQKGVREIKPFITVKRYKEQF